MKKLIYSLAVILAGLTSCTSFDDPVTEKYAAAPGIDVNVTAGVPSDSAFTVTITPGEGTLYYAYVVGSGAAPQQLDSATLYKGGYGNAVVEAKEQPTTTFTIDEALPNTTYWVYAVAGNDKGIIGSIVTKSITTSDGLNPTPKTVKRDEDAKSVALGFSENVTRGEGAVKAVYYKEWDIMNPVEISAEDFTVEIAKNTVTFAAPTAPAGAYVCFSYDAGAFKDGKGNPCGALTSGLNMNTGKFTNAYVHVTNESFTIEDEYVAPASGSKIGVWTDFKGTITFPFDIYRSEQYVEKGDLKVVYSNEDREISYNLTADQWSVEGKTLTFVLPVEPTQGDNVVLYVVSGAIADVYGNANEDYSTAGIELTYAGFIPTVDMVFGTFDFTYYSAYDDTPQLYDGGTVTIVKNPEVEGHAEDGIAVMGMFGAAAEDYLEGHYDLAAGKVIIDALQIVGEDEYKGEKIWLVLYNVAQTDEVAFDINPDGTLTSKEVGLVAYTADFSSVLGWWEKCSIATLTPKASAARGFKAAKAFKKTTKKAAKKVKAMNVRNLKHIGK